MIGHAKARRLAIELVGNVPSPGLIVGVLIGAVDQQDPQRNRRNGYRTRAAVQGRQAVQRARRSRRIHPARADLPVPAAVRWSGDKPAPRLGVAMPAPAQTLFAKVPAAQQLARELLFWGHKATATALVWDTPLTGLVARRGKAHLHRQVKDRWLRSQLTPDFTPGCKRMLVSSDYYPALQRDNCKLIDWPIATMSPAGIRTSDGVEHHLDAIVFATGYDVHFGRCGPSGSRTTSRSHGTRTPPSAPASARDQQA
jgi:hypothetical protein